MWQKKRRRGEERKRWRHDRNNNGGVASPRAWDSPGPFIARARDINHWITKPCLIASCISPCIQWLKGEGNSLYGFAGCRAWWNLIWTPTPPPPTTSTPRHRTLGTWRHVTRKNEVCSHLLINIALLLLSDHRRHLGLIKNVLNQSRRQRPPWGEGGGLQSLAAV